MDGGPSAFQFVFAFGASALCQDLVVFRQDLKIRLWMGSNRANLRRLVAHMDMTAVAADPDHLTLFAENLILFYVL